MHALSTAPIGERMIGRIMRRTISRILVVAGVVSMTLLLTAQGASAHPLGNFTVNRYARVELSAGVVRVYYVLDEAEIPAFQDRDALKANTATFTQERLDALAQYLTLK